MNARRVTKVHILEQTHYRFGETRVATLALLTFKALAETAYHFST
jgi:hypothetical protein